MTSPKNYKALELYRDLPNTNCRDCGSPGCFQFATAVYLQTVELDACPHLSDDKRAEISAKLSRSRNAGSGPQRPLYEQATKHLIGEIAKADLRAQARSTGGEYIADPEGVALPLFGESMIVGRDDVIVSDGAVPNVWVKVFMLYYTVSANGKPAVGKWVSFKELPNTVSKSKSYEENQDRLIEAFNGKTDRLSEACRSLGGSVEKSESADLEYLFTALPKVSLKLLFWDGDEDFPARASILLDAGILDYLDQEAICFLTEELVNRLLALNETK